MDFKFREKYPPRNSSNGFGPMVSQTFHKNNNDPLSKYAVGAKNNSRGSSKEKEEMRDSQYNSRKSKSNVDRYFRSERAPKNQYKKYMSDVNNVFYEERESLKQLKFYNNVKWVSGLFWLFLFVSYSSLFFVEPRSEKCPANAKCGAFVDCYNGFEFNSTKNQCVLSSELTDQIESVCEKTILRIREEWGNQECLDAGQSSSQSDVETFHAIPRFKLSQLLSQIENEQLLKQLSERMKNYLSNTERQSELGFEYQPSTNIIYPTKKTYSITCQMQLLLRTRYFRLGFPGALFVFCLISLIVIQIRKRFKVKNIYKELKERTFKEKSLNVSYAKDQLEKIYGRIDEDLWNLIDELRTKDRQIGYFQDDFLYWQAL